MLQQKIEAVKNISCSGKFLCLVLALGQASGDLVRVYRNEPVGETPKAVSIRLKSGL